MQIKSFKAPTLKEALANVKSELGVDAVILHTKKIKKGGILGFHAKEIVESIYSPIAILHQKWLVQSQLLTSLVNSLLRHNGIASLQQHHGWTVCKI